MKNKLYGLLIAAGVLFAISCSRNEGAADPTVNGEEVTVTFTVSSEGKMVSSRANTRISDGTKADMLIYAVYDQDGNLLPEYGQGKDSSLPDYIVAGEGQTIMAADKFPVEIKLQVKRDHTYKVALPSPTKSSSRTSTVCCTATSAALSAPKALPRL